MTISRRNLLIDLGCCCLPLLLGGCAGAPAGPVSAGYVPASNTDEAGLWQASERMERDIASSPIRIREGGVENYLHDVVCRLGSSHCPDIRVYLAHAPYFNASMMPNGTMQVWSGLLLRVENEAQLAAVLGHELGHYLHRHTLERWRRVRSSMTAAQLFGMGIVVAGGGPAASIPTLIAMADFFAYSRDQEREADTIGFELMTRAGYPPAAAAELWGNLIEEVAADPHHERNDLFFATHPAMEERRDSLRVHADNYVGPPTESGETTYMTRIKALRGRLLEDEVSLRQPERSLVLLARLRDHERDSAELAFYEGEVFRLRGEPGDTDRALELYEEAVAMGDAPPETYRAIGLIHRRAGRHEGATDAFRRYLELKPAAPDAELIRSYMLQISSIGY